MPRHSPPPATALKTVARAKTRHDLLRVGLALAHYKAENGKYPEALAELAPKYINTLPVDAFGGTPFVYRRRAEGYLLYSLGPNQRDEEGRSDDENGDDQVIEVPRPVKAKAQANVSVGSGTDSAINPDK